MATAPSFPGSRREAIAGQLQALGDSGTIVNLLAPTSTVTLALAIYGALLGTLNALWAIRKDVRDRGRLAVRVKVPTTPFYESGPIVGDLLVFEVVNTGRRVSFIKAVGGCYADGRPFALAIIGGHNQHPDSFPAKLEPSERVLIRTQLLSTPPSEVRRLGVWDTLGDSYFAPSADLRGAQRLHLKRAGQSPVLGTRTVLRGFLPLWVRV